MYNKVYENGILGEEQLSLHPQADNADIVQDKLYLQHAFTTDLKPFSVQYKFMNFLKNGFVYIYILWRNKNNPRIITEYSSSSLTMVMLFIVANP